MPQQRLGCFVTWFYLVLIVQTLLCIGQHECRQQHHNRNNNNNNHNNNNNNNRRGESPSSEENHSNAADDGLDTVGDSDSSIATGAHGPRRGARKKQNHNNNNNHNNRHNRNEENGISLWINEQQLKMLSALYFSPGYSGRIYAIQDGSVLNEMRDTSVYSYLVIPSEVNYVNFTWKSGRRKYNYDFDRLETMDESILKAPTLSINKRGRIPQEEKNFSIFLPCTGNSSGTASFNVGLKIQTRHNKPLNGTPIRLNFKKECAHRGVYDIDASNPTSLTTLQAPDPECSSKCGKNGFCKDHICKCHVGYTGQYCETAFCFPQCLNGGNCTAPSVCTCPDGYQGTQCEGGICKDKCENGGKCIQKDKCQCPKGYYGYRCEFSKCVIPCKSGGRCIGNNKCRCPHGLSGDHCEIGRKQRSICKCANGYCLSNRQCKCHDGYQGRHCRRRTSRRAH
ncbi:protein shifted isoform X1 [Drosophila busckii]|uniref:protein shifted isoform X1 n=1 Tax=Drosophila busckii TaxID=30019 RepID=UPI00083EFAD6|nr:protein shifted isoform X1 [Drosophila busckii]XP_017850218.1 protein shifted isoform X1 [Drosophila busckii]